MRYQVAGFDRTEEQHCASYLVIVGIVPRRVLGLSLVGRKFCQSPCAKSFNLSASREPLSASRAARRVLSSPSMWTMARISPSLAGSSTNTSAPATRSEDGATRLSRRMRSSARRAHFSITKAICRAPSRTGTDSLATRTRHVYRKSSSDWAIGQRRSSSL